MKKRLSWRACPDCGEQHWATQYLRPDGCWTGAPYCPPCRNERMKEWQRKVRDDMTWECAACHGSYHPTNREVGDDQQGCDWARLCSPDCYAAWRRRRYPSDLCYAPVVGGCGRPRSRDKHGHWETPYCSAHAKRRQHGMRMDTPIKARASVSK